MSPYTPSNTRLPRKGRDWEEICAELDERRRQSGDMAWDSLRNLKASYNGGGEVARIGWEAYTRFNGDNFLYGTTLYPSLPEIGSEIVGMAHELLNAPQGAGGTVTTGGTESILLAVRAAKNRAKETRALSGTAEIVVASNAHAAFTKAAELMEMRAIRVPIRNYRAHTEAIAEAITDNTVMVVGSAHAYPFGHVDDIAALSDLAEERDLWLHVDACIGGFFLPFAQDLGHDVPAFDFAVEGVNSISADLHKYGFTPRGASLLLLRDAEMTRHQGFEFADWETGRFDTPTISGSRPAGAVVAAWAVLNHLGFDGYRDLTAKTLAAKKLMMERLAGLGDIELCGTPHGGLIGYRGRGGIDMFAVRDALSERDWQTSVLTDPPGFQMILNYRSGEIVDEFANDLNAILRQAREGRLKAAGGDQSYGI